MRDLRAEMQAAAREITKIVTLPTGESFDEIVRVVNDGNPTMVILAASCAIQALLRSAVDLIGEGSTEDFMLALLDGMLAVHEP